jgi:hypothetical protein
MAIRKRNAQPGTTLASHGDVILKDAQRELKDPARRLLGKRILSLGGLALLSGCDLSTDKSVNTMLRKISFFNDDVQALLFDPKHMAPTYPESMITRPFPFNAFYDVDDVPEVDAATYRFRSAASRTASGSGRSMSCMRCRSRTRSHGISVLKGGARSAAGAACALPTS